MVGLLLLTGATKGRGLVDGVSTLGPTLHVLVTKLHPQHRFVGNIKIEGGFPPLKGLR